MIQIHYEEVTGPFDGHIVLSREFYNPDTKDYINIEAHQIGDAEILPETGLEDGDFAVAFWVPEGNDGDHGFSGSLTTVVKAMGEYTPPEGYQEMPIPEDAWQ